MSNKKYIDANALISECEEEIVDYDEDLRKHFIIKAVPTEYIEAFPAADVEEARYGKWIKLNTGYNVTDVYECSLCGRHLYVDKNTSNARIQKIAPYCHCGAKMDLTEVK